MKLNRKSSRCQLAKRMLLGAALLLPAGGCTWSQMFGGEAAVQTEELQSGMTKSELVAHLNDNIQRVSGWRSSDVEIKTKGPLGLPIGVNATMAVESPRNFRLIAESIRGNEADIGSNSDRFWMWMRPSEPQRVVSVRHEHVPYLQRQFNMPIRPDWIMEALGVVPLNPDELTLDPSSDQGTHYLLTSEESLPSGGMVRRTIEVDKRTGFVTRQRLVDATGTLIASATMTDFRTDSASGATLPHEIDLDWPQAGLTMTLEVGDMDVNPQHLATSLWEIPEIRSAPPLDLSRKIAMQMDAIETIPERPVHRRLRSEVEGGFQQTANSEFGEFKGPGDATSPFDAGSAPGGVPEWAKPLSEGFDRPVVHPPQFDN